LEVLSSPIYIKNFWNLKEGGGLEKKIIFFVFIFPLTFEGWRAGIALKKTKHF
jgi:hypothetical protein